MVLIDIEFDKLHYGSTFYHPDTKCNWVKVSESSAVKEDDNKDVEAQFNANDRVMI